MVLTTFRADGTLQSSPVTAGSTSKAGMIASYPQRAKSVTSDATRGQRCRLSDESTVLRTSRRDAEVIGMPDAVDLLVDYYR